MLCIIRWFHTRLAARGTARVAQRLRRGHLEEEGVVALDMRVLSLEKGEFALEMGVLSLEKGVPTVYTRIFSLEMGVFALEMGVF